MEDEKVYIQAVTFKEGGSWICWDEWRQLPNLPPPMDKRIHAINFAIGKKQYTLDVISGQRSFDPRL